MHLFYDTYIRTDGHSTVLRRSIESSMYFDMKQDPQQSKWTLQKEGFTQPQPTHLYVANNLGKYTQESKPTVVFNYCLWKREWGYTNRGLLNTEYVLGTRII